MKYGLIGKPLVHSFSPELHRRIGDYSYELRELSKEELKDFFDKEHGRDFQGLNVTIPYKTEVMKYLDSVDSGAALIGSVNTIVPDKHAKGLITGYNTDLFGFCGTLERMQVTLKDKKVLILGSGGTARMFCLAAVSGKAKQVLIVSRTPQKKQKDYAGFERAEVISYEDMYREHSDAQILLNATPLGMYPNEDGIPADISRFTGLEFVFDAIYHPLRTNLILEAEKHGIKACGGLYMLVHQGVESAKLFGEATRDPEVIYQELLAEKMNIVLIGMPSSGKTCVGNKLAEKLGKQVVDTDDEFEKAYGLTAGKYIKQFGEAAFREKEAVICETVAKLSGAVIATGGGMPLYGDNSQMLRQNGVLVYLKRSLSELQPTESRPLSADERKLAKLFRERTPRYEKAADFTVNGAKTAGATANRILRKLSEWRKP